MKKKTTAIIASAIYTIIGLLVSLSCFADQSSPRGESYSYGFSITDWIADMISDFFYNVAITTVEIPSLLGGLTADILACISLHIYNKNHTETTLSIVFHAISICILCSITLIYILGIIGISLLSL